MRIGNESVPAAPSQLRELVLRGSGESYDSLKSRYDFSNMSFTKLKSVYKQRTGNTFEDTDYESFGLIDEKGNLTNAGALLADESPVRHSRLFCTRWNGLTKASGIVDALDDKEYTGSLVTLLQAGTDFVRNNSKKARRRLPTRLSCKNTSNCDKKRSSIYSPSTKVRKLIEKTAIMIEKIYCLT